MARITVVHGRKFTLPTAAMIWSEYGSTPGQPAVMAISDSTATAGSLGSTRRIRSVSTTSRMMMPMPGSASRNGTL
ncbi:hypothetical protein G6F63_015401 [Rhizopus arrhizus]|nr:hypothetical protein G6F63_015401 [Rhizopus arrhizus]